MRAFVGAGLFVLGITLGGCDGGITSVDLETLAFEPDGFDGRDVRTTGVVVEFGAAEGARVRHFVIQDAEQNRVQLLPDEEAEPYVGRVVTVEGRFSFDETTGRRIEIDAIEPAVGPSANLPVNPQPAKRTRASTRG